MLRTECTLKNEEGKRLPTKTSSSSAVKAMTYSLNALDSAESKKNVSQELHARCLIVLWASLLSFEPVATRMEALCWLQTGRKKEGCTPPSCVLTGKLSSALDTLKWKSCKCQLPWRHFACRSMIGGVSSLSFGCYSLINCYFCQCGGRTHTWGFLAVIAAPVD